MRKNIILIFTVFSLVLFTNCKENDDTPAILNIDYVGFESGFTIGVAPDGNISQEVRIAVSIISSSDRTFELTVNEDFTTADASAYSIPSSVTVPANNNVGGFLVDVVGPNVNPSGEDVVVIDIINTAEGLLKSEGIALNLKQECPNPELILDITFDSWPEEIYWKVVDDADNTVFESATPADFGAYAGLADGIIKAMCLSSGSYTFSISDLFDDGAGPFTLSLGNEVIFSSDGVYGAGVDVPVTIP
ncbi:hypothetical protein [Hyunsoonleella rubra]|uniref:DUF4843 domain-containing protein n=1 Tax=Hyunsoonleella rubra TaxID=1737062 RepID=A0ABW5T7D5_9FLAO